MLLHGKGKPSGFAWFLHGVASVQTIANEQQHIVKVTFTIPAVVWWTHARACKQHERAPNNRA